MIVPIGNNTSMREESLWFGLLTICNTQAQMIKKAWQLLANLAVKQPQMIYLARLLGNSLVVGQRTLDPCGEVRILLPQPILLRRIRLAA